MTRRPLKVTQAEIERAIRAAKKAGAGGVEVIDGAIRIHLSPETVDGDETPLAPKREVVL